MLDHDAAPAHACTLVTSEVIDSRTSAGGLTVRRRRQCTICGKRFTTYESFPRLQWSPKDQERYAQAIHALQVALDTVRELGGLTEQALLEDRDEDDESGPD